VTTPDISPWFLQNIKRRFDDNVEFSLLNGKGLSQFEDNTFDMVSTYSVLHHIPDCFSSVKEMYRVTKTGKIIYIDHEVTPH